MQQLIARTAFLGVLFLATGCTSATPALPPQPPPQGGVLEFRLDSYDGRIVKGRLLLNATKSMFRIDSRRAGWYSLHFDAMHICGKTELIHYIEFDYMFSPIPPEHIIPIHPGKWYGENLEFSLSDYLVGHGEGPDCIETVWSARTFDRQTIAVLPIRLERTDKPAAVGPVGTTNTESGPESVTEKK